MLKCLTIMNGRNVNGRHQQKVKGEYELLKGYNETDRKFFKVVLLGDLGVGKTALMNQYVHNSFSFQYKATIGVDFQTKDVIVNDKIVSMKLWDTAGQERFRSLTSLFYRGAHSCILMYDVTRRDTFQSLDGYIEHFLLNALPKDPNNFPFVVVGNKIDLSCQAISSRHARRWCETRNNIPHFAISAKDATNVQETFQTIAEIILENEVEDLEANNFAEPINLRHHNCKHSCENNCFI